MFEWKNILDEHSAMARTPLACLRVNPDIEHSPGMAVIRYSARVETVNGAILRSQDDIDSMATARLWCEQSYVDLLEKEQERCYAAMRATS